MTIHPSKKPLAKPIRILPKSRALPQPLARRMACRMTQDKPAMPVRRLNALRKIVAQVRRSPGVGGNVLLFSGPSDTGKSLAAEVLANALGLDLYRVDLAAVVSKYIGETEKNLKRLLDAAEAFDAILLFDEADALFGKRSEVKDSHDRYANRETSYLLQRLENHNGLTILTTNRKGNIDDAFHRRLRFVVEFPFPSAKRRTQKQPIKRKKTRA